MFYQLKMKDWLYLAALVVITYLWIMYDQLIFVTSAQRMIAFSVFGLLLMTACFFIIKPPKPVALSNTLAVILIPLFVLLSIGLHVFVSRDGFQKKSILLWFMTALTIYIAGLVYQIIRKRK